MSLIIKRIFSLDILFAVFKSACYPFLLTLCLLLRKQGLLTWNRILCQRMSQYAPVLDPSRPELTWKPKRTEEKKKGGGRLVEILAVAIGGPWRPLEGHRGLQGSAIFYERELRERERGRERSERRERLQGVRKLVEMDPCFELTAPWDLFSPSDGHGSNLVALWPPCYLPLSPFLFLLSLFLFCFL